MPDKQKKELMNLTDIFHSPMNLTDKIFFILVDRQKIKAIDLDRQKIKDFEFDRQVKITVFCPIFHLTDNIFRYNEFARQLL